MIKPAPYNHAIDSAGRTLHLLVMDEQGTPLVLGAIPHQPQNPFLPTQWIEGEFRSSESAMEAAPLRRAIPISTMLRHVESALRRLFDLVYLCDHPLAQLRAVNARFQAQKAPSSCLVRARIVIALLTQAIEQLRPEGPVPGRAVIPRRAWHSYLILYHAYVEGETNYQIMNWLQVSEGTFNRTRRSALHAVAKVLQEMEQQFL